MSTIPTATRNAVAELYRDLLDAATSPGTAVFETSGDSEVATCTLNDPCTGSASGGVITFNSITSDTDATGGVIDHVTYYDGDSTEVIQATIATDSSEELQIGNLTITAGSTVGFSSLTLTQPAS
jgi:hypothetical protein